MKVSRAAIKLSLPGLTNVKKEKVLGITHFDWFFISSESKFYPLTR
ncbi:hypothetical protein AC520_0650 [Enterobacter sp. OLF]|nr:hypothetical protein AC520_1814 [Enterobacter sp. OLF]PUB53640.1 hypothetical protein AC520_0650 [Enterobacter sp. OLF]